MNLPDNTFLQGGKYRIIRFISSGGFGCTYEAELVLLHKRVAIKEFFVKDFCNRDENTSHVTVATQSKVKLIERLKQKFIEEASALFSMQHPNIVRVTDVFEENGTAYYVMDYIDGQSLQEIVKEKGVLNESLAVRYIKQVADALRYIHNQNRLHLDVKPGNIMVDKSEQAILIDFGASKQYDEVDGENTSTLLGKTPGYAPIEQMSNRVNTFSPATDIYSLGATLYKLVTGITPPDSAIIADDESELQPIQESVSSNLKSAVQKAMAVRRKDRYQNVDDFLSDIDKTIVHTEEQTLLDLDFEGNEGDNFVDLGLSVKWAKCNLGAQNPYDEGIMFGWGDATGQNISTDLKSYPSNVSHISGTIYDISLKLDENSRLPTSNEFQELVDKCKWTWTQINGKNGYEIKALNGHSIFLPTTRYRKGRIISECNDNGYYWSDTLCSFASAFALSFDENNIVINELVKYIGHCVRPVQR